MTKGTILIIDDEEQFRKVLSKILELEEYRVIQAENPAKGLRILEQEKDILLVITDVRLPEENGIQLLQTIKAKYPFCEVIVMTAFGTIHDGVYAMKLGAFDYITKGDGDDQIIVTVDRAIEKARLQHRIAELESKLGVRYNFDKIIGKSKIINDCLKLARKVAPTDSAVLLEGETGTGKELFAQSIHNDSPRKNKPFVAINCSAFSKELLESEMFGYKKGAFTGATSDKKGLFEEANEGTLFLDEIGEMDHDLQARLLRVLEEQSFIRIGDTRLLKVNVRIIAATIRDLQDEIRQDRFRADLYYRLSAFKIHLPSLRERAEDISLLAEHFISVSSAKTKKRNLAASPDFMYKLSGYSWPGNTRELKNIIERAVILSENELLTPELLPQEFSLSSDPPDQSPVTSLEVVEKKHIIKVLEYTRGNKTKTASILGIGVPTLYRKLELYGIR